MIYPSAKISHWNRLMSSTLKFKIIKHKIKTKGSFWTLKVKKIKKNFIVSGPCIVQYIYIYIYIYMCVCVCVCVCVSKTNKMHTLFPLFVSIYCPLHVSKKQVYHQEVTSVHAAYSIFHARVWCLTYLLTYTMEQSPSWEANRFLQLVKKFPAFLEPEGSSPYPQAPATSPYPEPTLSSPHNSLPLPEDSS